MQFDNVGNASFVTSKAHMTMATVRNASILFCTVYACVGPAQSSAQTDFRSLLLQDPIFQAFVAGLEATAGECRNLKPQFYDRYVNVYRAEPNKARRGLLEEFVLRFDCWAKYNASVELEYVLDIKPYFTDSGYGHFTRASFEYDYLSYYVTKQISDVEVGSRDKNRSVLAHPLIQTTSKVLARQMPVSCELGRVRTPTTAAGLVDDSGLDVEQFAVSLECPQTSANCSDRYTYHGRYYPTKDYSVVDWVMYGRLCA